MDLILVITLIEDHLSLKPETHTVPHGATFFDIDNFSDDLVISTAIRAISESNSIRLEVRAMEGAKLGGVLKVINTLVKYSGDLKMSFSGSHLQLQKMLSRLPAS
ncbi:MAG: hypothetical protein AAGF85_12760 [Bacteroidota bacterium]